MDYGIDKDESYMNHVTGSVAKGSEWLKDFEESPTLSWEAWGGNTLIHVKNINGEWLEA